VQRRSGYVVAGGGLLAVLGVLVASVIWVSESSKQPLVQPNPPAPSASPTEAAGPLPLPVTTSEEPPPAAPPTEAMSPSQLTAETMAPAPPRHRRLHELFPNLFPNG